MSMKREIFEALHCAETETEHMKIQPFLKSVLTRFQAVYYLWQNLSLDEMVIGWKGPFKNRQCNCNTSKPKKFHIKIFGLCDSVTSYTTC